MSAIELREQLNSLLLERALVESTPLGDNAAYMADLEEEIDEFNAAYVGAAVTEIASFRAELDGPNWG